MARSRTVLTAVCGLTAVALVALVVTKPWDSGSKPTTPGGTGPAAAAGSSSSPTPAATPESVAQAFLAAWSAGDYAKAGSLSDAPDTATAGLKNVMTTLGPQKVTLTLGAASDAAPSGSASAPGSGSGTDPSTSAASTAAPSVGRYAFSVVDDFGNNMVWPYQSALGLVPDSSGAPVVHWASSVIHPSLSSSALLKAVPPKNSVTDADGKAIDKTAHPTLAPAVNALAAKIPAGQTPTSLTVEFIDANTGTQIANSQSWPLGSPGSATSATLKTTLKMPVQSAIEAALKRYPDSAMVAIQPSTGAILGMAANSTTNTRMAYQAARAPGSTFKVITTALALQKGLKPGDPVDCTPTATVEGKAIENDKDLANGIPHATLKDAFVQSCNTAFVNLATKGKLGSDYSALADEAKTYFGLNQKWDLGLGTAATYGAVKDQQVPVADGLGSFAREAFGQDKITMAPLVMASVAATVC
ncbi:MAG: penicillin-binding transpeptidase domain-containing protein, partial [Catenulispora sp.]